MQLISNAAGTYAAIRHSPSLTSLPVRIKIYFVQNILAELKIMQRIKNLTSAYPLSATPAATSEGRWKMADGANRQFFLLRETSLSIFKFWHFQQVTRQPEGDREQGENRDNIASMQIGQK